VSEQAWRKTYHLKPEPPWVDTVGVNSRSVARGPVVLLLPLLLVVWGGTITSLSAAAPPVTITAPTTDSVFTAPASFTIRASVSGGGNNVSQIEFFEGANSLGVVTGNPYRLDVNNLPAGTYILLAILTDNVGGKSSNSVRIIVNELPSLSITNPSDGDGLIAPATFMLQAMASDIDGAVTQVQFFRGTTSIGLLTNAPYTIPIKNLLAGSYTFEVVATDNLGGIKRASIEVLVKRRPTVTFTAPAAGARLTEATNVLVGTASDSVSISNVEVSVNGGAFTPASGTTDWNSLVLLPAGTNVLWVRATDTFGNHSLTNKRSVFQVVTGALALTIAGTGTVSGATNGQSLEVGRGYHLLATPGPGYVFSNWTGHAFSTVPALSFLMQSNMSLQAHFVPNPFLRVGGTYNGLFFETNGVRHESSGDFRLRVSSTGKYRVSLRLAGQRYAANGQLDLEGNATNVIARSGTSSLTVRWAVDLQGFDQVTGTVTDGFWLSESLGDRAFFNATTNPASLSGRYTFVLPSSPSVDAPDAAGWGTLKVTTAGTGSGAGLLSDGTKFSYKAPVSKNGAWPLYVPLYQTKGSLIGWLQFNTNAPLDDVSGSVMWFKPGLPDARYYPAGFTNLTTLTGSRYVAPTTSRVLALTNGVMILTGGNLSQAWTNDFVLGANNRVTNTSPNKFTMTMSLATGLFQGSFLDTGVGRTVSFSGALLQKSTNGSGFFLGTDQAGRVLIEGQP
jgi:uncharacterized repeat protein (TIGR02543 family)